MIFQDFYEASLLNGQLPRAPTLAEFNSMAETRREKIKWTINVKCRKKSLPFNSLGLTRAKSYGQVTFSVLSGEEDRAPKRDHRENLPEHHPSFKRRLKLH